MYLFFAVSGLPSLALFALRQNRVVHVAMATAWFITSCVMFIPQAAFESIFIRNFIMGKRVTFMLMNSRSLSYHNCAGGLYEVGHVLTFLTIREHSSRQLFSVRQQLKQQYLYAQPCQS